jgi:two-component system C4-dicarboxylate transport sensor histidine kinase DctB
MPAQLKKNLKITAAVTVTFLAAVFTAFYVVRQDSLSELRRETQVKLDHFSASVFAPTDKYTYLPSLVAQYSEIQTLLADPSEKNVLNSNMLLSDINGRAGAAVLYVLSSEGIAIASSDYAAHETIVGKNLSFRPYFTDAMATGSGRFYGVGTISGVPGYYVASAVKRNGVIVGAVVAKVDLRDLYLGSDKGKFEMGVTDKLGVVFLSTKPDWNYRPTVKLTASLLNQIKRERQYENQLRAMLPVEFANELSPAERIATIADHPDDPDSIKRTYLMNRTPLRGSDWTVYILSPMDTVELRAAIAAGIAAITFGTLGLLVLNGYQRRHLASERARSRAELEQAHVLLEQKHRELQDANEELHRASITDPLTGAYNRRFFVEAFAKLSEMAQRYNSPLSIVLIDVDHFKKVNDIHGHSAGDKVLIALADLYRAEMRGSDVFARLGGEEFAMALHNSDAASSIQVAERLREKVMGRPVEVDGQVINITVSCGVALHTPALASLDSTMERADKALYRAKHSGRNRVALAGS